MSINHDRSDLDTIELPSAENLCPLIPRVVHLSWKNNNIPKHWEETHKNWVRLHPDWTILFWTDVMLHSLVAQKFPSLLSVYTSFSHNIQRCDFSRALLLYEYGGIYMDLDICPIRNMLPIVDFHNALEHEIVFAQSAVTHDHYPPPTNALMLSRPRNDFWKTYIEVMSDPSMYTFTGKAILTNIRHFEIISSTGPMALAFAIRLHKQRSPQCSVGYISNTLVQFSPHWNDRPASTVGAPVKLLMGGSWHKKDSVIMSKLDQAWSRRNDLFAVSVMINVLLVVLMALVMTKQHCGREK